MSSSISPTKNPFESSNLNWDDPFESSNVHPNEISWDNPFESSSVDSTKVSSELQRTRFRLLDSADIIPPLSYPTYSQVLNLINDYLGPDEDQEKEVEAQASFLRLETSLQRFESLFGSKRAAGYKLNKIRSDCMKFSGIFDKYNASMIDRIDETLEITNAYLGPDEEQEAEIARERISLSDFLLYREMMGLWRASHALFDHRILSERDICIHAPSEASDYLEIFNKVISRIKEEYPDELGLFLQFEGTPEETYKELFRQPLEGLCAGTTNALVGYILNRKNGCDSLQKSVFLLKFEDMLHGQCIANLYFQTDSIYTNRLVDFELRHNSDFMRFLESRQQLATQAGLDSDVADLYRQAGDSIREQVLERQRMSRMRLTKNYLIGTFLDSDTFSAKDSAKKYQKVFERAIHHRYPKTSNFLGGVSLFGHILTFQYGPRGYFLYDCFDSNKGLFAYTNSKTFFKELRNHVIYDNQCGKEGFIEKDVRKLFSKQADISGGELGALEEEIENSVLCNRVHFSITPLPEDISKDEVQLKNIKKMIIKSSVLHSPLQ